jgi:hypothetical protein
VFTEIRDKLHNFSALRVCVSVCVCVCVCVCVLFWAITLSRIVKFALTLRTHVIIFMYVAQRTWTGGGENMKFVKHKGSFFITHINKYITYIYIHTYIYIYIYIYIASNPICFDVSASSSALSFYVVKITKVIKFTKSIKPVD